MRSVCFGGTGARMGKRAARPASKQSVIGGHNPDVMDVTYDIAFIFHTTAPNVTLRTEFP